MTTRINTAKPGKAPAMAVSALGGAWLLAGMDALEAAIVARFGVCNRGHDRCRSRGSEVQR